MATPDGLDEELALALAAVEDDPANAYGLAVVAERLRLAGREQEAAAAVRRAAALNPGDDRVLQEGRHSCSWWAISPPRSNRDACLSGVTLRILRRAST